MYDISGLLHPPLNGSQQRSQSLLCKEVHLPFPINIRIPNHKAPSLPLFPNMKMKRVNFESTTSQLRISNFLICTGSSHKGGHPNGDNSSCKALQCQEIHNIFYFSARGRRPRAFIQLTCPILLLLKFTSG